MLKEELEMMWRVKASVVPMVIGALRAASPKIGEWQIPGTTSKISAQRSAIKMHGLKLFPYISESEYMNGWIYHSCNYTF